MCLKEKVRREEVQLLVAVVPVVEVVRAVLHLRLLPLSGWLGLMLSQDALFELDEVVHAGVALVLGNEHGVDLLNAVLLGVEHVVGN